MKTEVLNGLLTARTLFEHARRLCFTRDRYLASAGLVVLQDAFELVAYCCLVELGVDQQKSIEGFSFDQLLGELRATGKKIVKSGTLKAMNKQRVLVKHHAQLAEPAAVQNYFEVSLLAADTLLKEVTGRDLHEIVVSEAIADEEARSHVESAAHHIEEGQYLEALLVIRKAIFITFERDYDIREWSDYDSTDPGYSRLRSLAWGGRKAPWHTRNKKWIEQNVHEPFQYVQIDDERLRLDLIEAGIDTVEFQNLCRLTPDVYRQADKSWAVRLTPLATALATEKNARYCLDLAVAALTKLQAREELVRRESTNVKWRALMLRDEPLLTQATMGSQKDQVLREGSVYEVESVVGPLKGEGLFVYISHLDLDPLVFYHGYIPVDACKLLAADSLEESAPEAPGGTPSQHRQEQ